MHASVVAETSVHYLVLPVAHSDVLASVERTLEMLLHKYNSRYASEQALVERHKAAGAWHSYQRNLVDDLRAAKSFAPGRRGDLLSEQLFGGRRY